MRRDARQECTGGGVGEDVQGQGRVSGRGYSRIRLRFVEGEDIMTEQCRGRGKGRGTEVPTV